MIHLDIQKRLQSTDGFMDLDIKCTIEQGQFVTLYGKSGAGKTSTLRMLAGLMNPDAGQIVVNDKSWFDKQKKINIKPQSRQIGLVFQDYALFPHMTVKENLEFAADNTPDSRVSQVIDIVELGALQHRKPDTLSGGQQQRVALARAVVQQPSILLLDEPLSALDLSIRLKLQDYILRIHNEYGLTTILISHDIAEIMKLSDIVFVLDKACISKSGSPESIFINKDISGKFKFTGEVLQIQKEEIIYVVTVLIQNNIVKVIAQESEIKTIQVGDKVMVASKAFNPLIYKIE